MVNHKTVTSKIYKTKTFIPPEEQYRHENFCEPIIDETTWKQAQFYWNSVHRLIHVRKMAGIFIAIRINKMLRLRGLLCSSHKKMERQSTLNTLATAHTATASNTVLRTQSVKISLTLWSKMKSEDFVKRYLPKANATTRLSRIAKKKPLYERQIQQLNDKILSLRQQIEDLIIERIGDREHAQVFNNMITKREEEISAIEKRITDLRNMTKSANREKNSLKTQHRYLMKSCPRVRFRISI